MARHLTRWLVITALLLLLVAVFNLVIDPYGIFRQVDRPGFNAIKPTATTRGGMAKATGVLRERPAGLVLGNSRAEVGFDPHHAGWPTAARPVFNLSIAGTGPVTTLRYFKHALASGRAPDTVVWGIDFMDFLVDPRSTRTEYEIPAEDVRLLQSHQDLHSTPYLRQRLKDVLESTLTLRAVTDSIQTLMAQSNRFAMDQTPLGFNPMHDYQKLAADQGYWTIFRQKDLTYVQSFLARPKSIFDARGNTSPDLEATRAILRLCREHGIKLRLVIYPYHAHFQQAFRMAGQWPAFEGWKRGMVRLVADEARASNQAAFQIWDFSGFNAWTSEIVPARGDRKTKMQWYWEAGHFKRELGDLVLNQVWDPAIRSSDLGTIIDETNVESHILKVRAQELTYRQLHPTVISALEAIATQSNQPKR